LSYSRPRTKRRTLGGAKLTTIVRNGR